MRRIAFGLIVAMIFATIIATVTSIHHDNVGSTQTPTTAPMTNSTAPKPTHDGRSRVSPFGTFVSEAPASASELDSAKQTIDEVKAAGLSVVYQYSFVQGTTELDQQYLDYAASKGVGVIIYLGDLWDGLPSYPQGGSLSDWLEVLSNNMGQQFSTSEDAVNYVMQTFESHPAVVGFSTSDELPQGPDVKDASAWKLRLAVRYQQLKRLTHKPILLTMVGDQPRSFFASLRAAGDELATDYYPVGNSAKSEPTALTRIGHDVQAAGWKISWASIQAFDMRDPDYGMADVAMTSSHFPTTDELVAMGTQAHSGGANGLLFFAWGSVQKHHAQAEVKKAIGRLRPAFE